MTAGLLAAQPGGWTGAPSGDGGAAVPDAWLLLSDAAFAGLLPGYAFAQSVTQTLSLTAADSISNDGTLELEGAYGIATFTSGGSTYAAVAAFDDDGVQMLDITDPSDITAVGSITDTEGANELLLNGAWDIATFESGGSTYAAVAAQSDNGVQILNVTDPSAITAEGNIADTATLALDRVRGIATFTLGGSTYAAVASSTEDGVQILNVTDPSAVTAEGNITNTPALLLNSPHGIATFTSGGSTYAAVAANLDGVQILNVTDPSSVTAAGNIANNSTLELGGARDIAIFESGGSIYAAVAADSDDGVQILNITDPSAITAEGNITDTASLELYGARGIATFTSGGSTYAAVASSVDSGVQILDITDPSAITAAGSIADTTSLKLSEAQSIATFTSGGSTYAAVAAYDDSGVQILRLTSPLPPPENAFVTTWETTGANQAITIPATGTYSIDWGDGTVNATASGTQTHTYADAGNYTVAITGGLESININSLPSQAEKDKLRSIDQWGNITWTTMEGAFRGASNMAYDAADTPDLSGVASMNSMFRDTSFSANLSGWNVSQVTDMNYMFYDAASFNGNLSGWDVSSVTGMDGMFEDASSFDQPLNDWNVSHVQDMRNMFSGASSFNQPLNDWNVSSVTSMFATFRNADSFNGNLSGWDVSQVTSMNNMFRGASSFNQPLDTWNVSSATSMAFMFYDADRFNQDLGSWTVSSVETMEYMFGSSTSNSAFNGNISAWDVYSVTNMEGMFNSAVSFNQPLNDWNVSSVTNMIEMFEDATSFNQPISDWDIPQVTAMEDMFHGAAAFNQDISTWDVSSVRFMAGMFTDATSFDQNLGEWYVVLNSTEIDAAAAPGVVGTISAQNQFLRGQNPTYAIGTGGDSGSFNITGGSNLNMNITSPAKSLYTVNITSAGGFSTPNYRVYNVTVTGFDTNSQPTVNAGPDQTVDEGDTVTLSGTASDSDNDPLTYMWTHDSDLPITLADDTALSTTFTAPAVTQDTTVTFTLAVSDATDSATDTVSVTITDTTPGSIPPAVLTNPSSYQHDSSRDITLDGGNTAARGVWSDGTTIWVVDADDDKLYAYTLADGTYDSAKDITLYSGHIFAQGVWSDGTTVWVVDSHDEMLHAYAFDGTHVPAKDITLDGDNTSALGVWSDGTTIWVADTGDDKLYAYALADGTYDPTRDITLDSDNSSPIGTWSDGITIWVVDTGDDKLYAYALAGGTYDPTRDIPLDSDNGSPAGVWSDGTTMWVADTGDDKLYAYSGAIPPAVDAGPGLTAADSITDTGALKLFNARGIATFESGGGTYAAVTGYLDYGVQILDVTDPYGITAAGSIADDAALELAGAWDVATFTSGGGTYAAVTAYFGDGVQILNVTDPSDITATDSIGDTETRELSGAYGIATFTSGSRTYAAVTALWDDDGVQILDVTNPSDITAAGSIGDTRTLELSGASDVATFTSGGRTYAAVAAYWDDGVQILDVTNPSAVTAAGSIGDTAALELDGAHDITTFTSGSRTYAAVAAYWDDGVQILDVTDPSAITAAGSITDDAALELDGAEGITVFESGGRTYAAVASVVDDGVQMLDITDPSDITAVGSITDDAALELLGASGIATFTSGGDTYAAVTAHFDSGVQILRLTGGGAILTVSGQFVGEPDNAQGFAESGTVIPRLAIRDLSNVQVAPDSPPTVTSIERSDPAGAATSERTLVFAVTFSEDVTGVDLSDFALSPGSTGGGGSSGQFTQTSEPATRIADRSTIQDAITVDQPGTATSVSVAVDISHTYRGDLVIVLIAPDGTSQTLHSRTGGSANDIDRTYAPDFDGTGIAGDWTLRVSDRAGGDVGTLNGWTLTIGHGGAGSPVTGLAGSGDAYLVTVSAAQDGTYNLDLVSSGHGITDAADNPLTDTVPTTGTDHTYTVGTAPVDTAAPTLASIERYSPADQNTDSQTLVYKVTFSEDVTGVDLSDFALSSGGTGTGSVTNLAGSGSQYLVTVSAAQDGTYNLDLVSSGHGITDTAGNPLSSPAPTGADHTYTVSATPADATAPTVTSIERSDPAEATTSERTLVFAVTFSEDVTGVDLSDFALSPDSTGGGSSSGQFTQTSEPATRIADRSTIQDAITVDRSGTATSVSVAVDISHTYRGDLVIDLIAPDGTSQTLHSRTGGSANDIDRTYAPDFDGTGIAGDWTLRVSDRAGGDVGTLNGWTLTIGHGTAGSPVTGLAGSGDAYLVTVSAAQDGTYNLDLVSSGHGITDSAGNPLTDTVPTTGTDHTYTVGTAPADTTAPTLASIERYSPADQDTDSQTLVYKVTFSEDVTGVDTGDFVLSQGSTGTGSTASLTGSGSVYYATVSAAQDGTYNLDLVSSGHGITDTAGNPLSSPAPTGADHTYTVSATPADATAPTVTSIERSDPAEATTSERTLVFAVTFSEDVTGVDLSDFALSPGSTGGSSSSGQFTQTSEPATRIADRSTIQDAITVDRSGTATSVSAAVDISHTYRGDLVIDLIAPDGTSQTLHSRTGGSANDIDQTYAPDFDGTGIAGDWTLRVSDRAGGDVGTLNGWTLTIGHGTAGSPVTDLTGSGDAYLVTVSAAQDGTYNLDLVSSDHGIADAANNPLSSPTPTGADHTYTVHTPAIQGDTTNTPPSVSAGPDQTVQGGQAVSLTGTATDVDGDPLTYSWSHDSALAIEFANSTAPSTTFTAPQVSSNTTFTLTLTVDDGAQAASDSMGITIVEAPGSPRGIGEITLASTEPGVMVASWEAPTETPADYRMAWAKVGEPYLTWTNLSGNAFPTSPSQTVTGLEEGEQYKVKVRARYSSGGPGDWSGEFNVTVAGTG